MADTGLLLAGSAADRGAGDASWTSLANIYDGNDASYASCAPAANDYSNRVEGNTFGASIPSGATVDGIEVSFRASASGNGHDLVQVQLVIGGVAVGSNLHASTAWDFAETNLTFGGPTEKWGLTPVDTDLTPANFGFLLQTVDNDSSAETIRLHAMWVRIYYTAAVIAEDAEGAFSIAPVTVDGAGIREVLATGAITLDGTTLAGAIITGFHGVGGIRFPEILMDGFVAVNVGIIENAAVTISSVLVEGAAYKTTHSAGAFETGAVLVDGSSLLLETAAGAFSIEPVLVSGSAVIVDTATGAIELGGVTLRGRAGRLVDVAGDINLGTITLAGITRKVDSVATGQIVLAQAFPFAVEGAVSRSTAMTGAVTLGAVTLSGVASVPTPPEEAAGAFSVGSVVISGSATDRANSFSTSAALVFPTGFAVRGRTAMFTTYSTEGAAVLAALTVRGRTGHLVLHQPAGAPVLPSVTVQGAAYNSKIATGAFSMSSVTVDGFVPKPFFASGAFTTGSVLVSGVPQYTRNTAGAITLGACVLTGLARSSWHATGAFTLAQIVLATQANKQYNTRGFLVFAPVRSVSGAGHKESGGPGTVLLQPIDVRAKVISDDLSAYQWYEVRSVRNIQGSNQKRVMLTARKKPTRRTL